MDEISNLFYTVDKIYYDGYHEWPGNHRVKVGRLFYDALIDYCKSLGSYSGDCTNSDDDAVGYIYGIPVILDDTIDSWEII